LYDEVSAIVGANHRESSMTFFESIQTCLTRYATFDGTASRSEFWWFFLFQMIAGAITQEISVTLGGVFALAMLLPGIAVTARRLHDTDRSGWLQLLWLIPIVGWIIVIVFLAQESRPNRYGTAPVYVA
jgi:uncharacterized membrane protein YhaH (DUF805 family)